MSKRINHMLHRSEMSHRTGVTVIEVLFAMMIVLIGLAGIAGLLPVALRQASDSFELSRGAVMSQSMFQQAIGSGLTSRATQPWLVANEDPSFAMGFGLYDGSTSTNVGWCVDPLFWASQPGVDTATILPCNGTEGGYRRARFPYYREDYDPLANPDTNMSATPPVFSTPAAHARMFRVSLPRGTSIAPMNRMVAEQRFASADDFVRQSLAKDEPFQRYFLSNSSSVAQKAATTNEFTWMATFSPNELGPDTFYTMGVVVFRNRDRLFQAGKLPAFGYDPIKPPTEERLAWATPLSVTARTTGGSGFSMQLSSRYIDEGSDRLRVGDWLMLSRKILLAPGSYKAVFRWYRVSAATRSVITQPSAGNKVWTREVFVTGSDWKFATPAEIAVDGSVATQATLVNDVVTVTEKTVPVD